MPDEILSRFTKPGETWRSLVDRVSDMGESRSRSQFRDMIGNKIFIPGGQILRGAGDSKSVLYNCFVTGVGDEEQGENLASRISDWTKQGAGVGVNLDQIGRSARQQGSSVCQVIDHIAASQHRLWQNGITRTATMVTLSVSDPEIEAAATLMTSAEHFRHLNLGVLVGDQDVIIHAKTLASLCTVAWRTGNPGFIFIDRVRRDHKFPDIVHACNPCGEQFLADDEGCNLGSLNLAAFVTNNRVDWAGFDEAARLAVRFLDDIVDASAFPSKATALMAKRRRRIGLGVLGFASALYELGIPYGSPESISIAQDWGAALRKSANEASKELARERGAFLESADGLMRNSHLLSIAPTGAISMLCNTSSGIEPFFGEKIYKGSIEIDFFRDEPMQPAKPRAPRADEIEPLGHVAVLAAWQSSIDGGISKTVNMPFAATSEEMQRVVHEAWKRGCKGVSLFRDGSRLPAIGRGDAERATETKRALVRSPNLRAKATNNVLVQLDAGPSI